MALRKALARAGYRVHGWGLGWNLGVKRRHARPARSLHSTGWAPRSRCCWSAGAWAGCSRANWRGNARTRCGRWSLWARPSPATSHQNNIWPLYERIAGHKVDEPPIPRILDKPPVPSLALWSRKDGIVAPRAAYGLEGERDEAVEMECAHMAFGVSRRTAELVVREIDRFLKKHAESTEHLVSAA